MRLAISILLCFLFLNNSSQEILKIKVAKPGKPLEKCSASLLGRPGGNITKAELASCNRVEVTGPCDYKVISFDLSFAIHDNLKSFHSDSVMTGMAKGCMMGLPINSKFFIEKIKVKSNITGRIFRMPDLKFKVVP